MLHKNVLISYYLVGWFFLGGLLVLFASPLLVLTLLAIINLEVSSRMVTFK